MDETETGLARPFSLALLRRLGFQLLYAADMPPTLTYNLNSQNPIQNACSRLTLAFLPPLHAPPGEVGETETGLPSPSSPTLLPRLQFQRLYAGDTPATLTENVNSQNPIQNPCSRLNLPLFPPLHVPPGSQQRLRTRLICLSHLHPPSSQWILHIRPVLSLNACDAHLSSF